MSLFNDIAKTNKVPAHDIAMHVAAIEAGDYTLVELLQNAPAWYGMSGQQLDDILKEGI